MIDFDAFSGDGDTATETAAGQICPEGTHVATIGWVKVQPKDWAKTKANPGGQCLTVRLDFKDGIKSVFDSIPLDRRGSIEALCRSARIDLPGRQWDESELREATVTVETVLAVSKQGNDYVKVTAYKPNAPPLPPEIRERANRTPTQKADAATGAPDDDIPF